MILCSGQFCSFPSEDVSLELSFFDSENDINIPHVNYLENHTQMLAVREDIQTIRQTNQKF